MNDYVAGSTSVVEAIFLQDSTSTVGAGKTGLAYNTAGLTCYYIRSNGTASQQVFLANIPTLGIFVPAGFKEIDSVNQPGLYEFHPPNAALVAGASWVIFYFVGATGLVARPIKVRLLAVNPDLVSFGLSLAKTTNITGFTDIAAADVWAVGTRTLTGFGTLVSDIWAYTTRILTAGTNIVLAKGTGLTGLNDIAAGAQMDLVAVPNATALSAIGTAVWATTTRTLSGFGTLVSDIWAYTTRILTAGTNIVLAKGTGLTGLNDIAASDVWAVGSRTLTAFGFTVSTSPNATELAIKTVTDNLATALELSGSAYRFTSAALALAPAGGGGGSTVIMVSPLTAIIPSDTIVSSGTTQAFRYCPLPIGPIAIVDADNLPVDLSGGVLVMYCVNDANKVDFFTLKSSTGELVIGGTDHNQITVNYVPQVAGRYWRRTYWKPAAVPKFFEIETGYWEIDDGPDPALL